MKAEGGQSVRALQEPQTTADDGAPRPRSTAIVIGSTAEDERHGHRGRPAARSRTTAEPAAAPSTREHVRGVRARQREEFGGVNWGAAFFGWLVAVGLGALLVGLLAAAGAAVGLTEVSATPPPARVAEIRLGGAIALLAALADRLLLRRLRRRADVALRRRAPGHRRVADRAARSRSCSRSPPSLLGSEYNVLERLDLPRTAGRRPRAGDRRRVRARRGRARHAAGRRGRRQGGGALPPQGRPRRFRATTVELSAYGGVWNPTPSGVGASQWPERATHA